ncbi:MAG: hypothetical protein KBT27_06670 [Prevotellaceae bacterium]|nr:hypothetical protein [Candidatus Faecinaster equi]
MKLDEQQKVIIKHRLQNSINYFKENNIADFSKFDTEKYINQDFQGEQLALLMIMLYQEEFANELKRRLNFNLNRYHGGFCNGREFPNVETFDVDEVYECIDRILGGIPEDTNT